jgi:hypothetical protein
MLRTVILFCSHLGKPSAHVPNHYAPFFTIVLATLLYERNSKVGKGYP